MINEPLNKYDRADLKHRDRETVFCIRYGEKSKVEGQLVTVGNGLFNFWSWVAPLSPFTAQIARHGGYFQMKSDHKRGIVK